MNKKPLYEKSLYILILVITKSFNQIMTFNILYSIKDLKQFIFISDVYILYKLIRDY